MNLLVVEMRRALHRRVVWVLIGLALVGCALAGVLAFTSSAGRTLAELHADGATHPAVLRDWWISGGDDGAVTIASLFLLLGGVIGGATVAGAEWRAGTVATVLTWEPRRTRAFWARNGACAVLAFGIAVALQVVFLASLLPAVVARGFTDGTDSAWWVALAAAVLRTALLTSGAALLGCALATLGRNTAFALVTVFGWLLVVEGMLRNLRPSLARFLWAENIGTVVQWARLDTVPRDPVTALVTVAAYVGVVAAVSAWVFARRDLASAS
jgi:hypothetical protein